LRIDHCEYPDGLLYDVEQGTWVDPKEGVARVGITSLLSFSFGVFSAVTFRSLGMPLGRGQVMGTMEGSRHFDVFRSPVPGTLSAVNTRLTEEPWLLNRDPYGEGWFAEIKIEAKEEFEGLGRLPAVEPRIAQLLRERHVHCYAAFPDLQIFDTGVECQAVLAKLNEVMESIGRAGRAMVDVRGPKEFSGEILAPPEYPTEHAQRGGHIPGAVSIPWGQAVNDADGTFKPREELEKLYGSKGILPEKEIVAYCRIGERSSHTWFVLSYLLGYPRVRNYDGSWTEWGNSVRLPIER